MSDLRGGCPLAAACVKRSARGLPPSKRITGRSLACNGRGQCSTPRDGYSYADPAPSVNRGAGTAGRGPANSRQTPNPRADRPVQPVPVRMRGSGPGALIFGLIAFRVASPAPACPAQRPPTKPGRVPGPAPQAWTSSRHTARRPAIAQGPSQRTAVAADDPSGSLATHRGGRQPPIRLPPDAPGRTAAASNRLLGSHPPHLPHAPRITQSAQSGHDWRT